MADDLLPNDEEELRTALLMPPSELTPDDVDNVLKHKRAFESLLRGCAAAAEHIRKENAHV